MCIYMKYSHFLQPRQGKRIITICLMYLLFSPFLYPMENNGRGTKAIGMANAFAAVADNPWAVNYNPAGLAQLKEIQCSAFLIPGQYGMPELRTCAFSAAIPFSFAVLALKAEKFGFELYSENEIGVSFGIKLCGSISGGISLNCNRIEIAGYGHRQKLLINGGILADALSNLKIGFNFTNLTGTKISSGEEKYPQVISLGASWLAVEDLMLSLEIEKDIRYSEIIKFGLQQKIIDVLALQAGVSNNPAKFSSGLAVKLFFCEFGYACYTHSELGLTHQIEITGKLFN
ncbi:MAG: hypothetical protein JXA06_07260 [Bacteroidetes bacterium]|nr:hypothetical protein [Bacteroidota bacterium]